MTETMNSSLVDADLFFILPVKGCLFGFLLQIPHQWESCVRVPFPFAAHWASGKLKEGLEHINTLWPYLFSWNRSLGKFQDRLGHKEKARTFQRLQCICTHCLASALSQTQSQRRSIKAITQDINELNLVLMAWKSKNISPCLNEMPSKSESLQLYYDYVDYWFSLPCRKEVELKIDKNSIFWRAQMTVDHVYSVFILQ